MPGDVEDFVDLFEQYRSFCGKAPTPDARTFLAERIETVANQLHRTVTVEGATLESTLGATGDRVGELVLVVQTDDVHQVDRAHQRRVVQCEQGAVLGDERGGVAVVGRDGGLGDGEPLAQRGFGLRVAGQRAQPQVHPLVQLAGGLAGEGQPEDLLRRHDLVGHQPGHPGGHRLGLPGTRAGDHHERPVGRGLDHAGLLGGRRVGQPAPGGDLGRGEQPPRAGRCLRGLGQEVVERELRHPVTCRPGSCSGQLRRVGRGSVDP